MPRSQTNTERIFKVLNKTTKKVVKAVSKVEGQYCELFYPKPSTQRLDVPKVLDDDAELLGNDYHIVPDKKGNYIVLGIFGDQYRASDSTLDNYDNDQPFILTHKDELIPKLTRVKVYRGKNYFDMKVQEHNVYPSVGINRIYIKNLLVPFN